MEHIYSQHFQIVNQQPNSEPNTVMESKCTMTEEEVTKAVEIKSLMIIKPPIIEDVCESRLKRMNPCLELHFDKYYEHVFHYYRLLKENQGRTKPSTIEKTIKTRKC
jgi:hypothetical protein